MGKFYRYHKMLTARAWIESKLSLGLEWSIQKMLLAFALWVIATLILQFIFNINDSAQGDIIHWFASFSAMVLVFMGFFIFNLIIAPVKIYHEQQAEIEKLKGKLTRRKKNKELMSALIEQHKKGVALKHHYLEQDNAEKVNEWVCRTKTLLESNSFLGRYLTSFELASSIGGKLSAVEAAAKSASLLLRSK